LANNGRRHRRQQWHATARSARRSGSAATSTRHCTTSRMPYDPSSAANVRQRPSIAAQAVSKPPTLGKALRAGPLATTVRPRCNLIRLPSASALLHAAFTLRALGAPLLRVARIQSSATDVFSTNATANDVSQSTAFCASVGSATMSRAGM
jgi:hypothetical protein